MEEKPVLLAVKQALELLLAAAVPVGEVQTLTSLEANGRLLAADQVSTMDVPGSDNAQMDGYAVRVADCAAGPDGTIRLPVAQRIVAGKPGHALAVGTAARIFTGALIPDGADAVVMQEDCGVEPGQPDGAGGAALPTLVLQSAPAPGAWIRRRGEDIGSGSVILHAGTRLRPPQLGLAASVGLSRLPVRRRVRVAIFFTGDELAMPGETLHPGAIYNSNRFVLRPLLENLGCIVTDYGIVPDQLAATRDMLRAAAADNDLIVTSGGVSVGEEDHVKPAVEAEGRLALWKIAMKPGKPLAFGAVRKPACGETHFIGLPGNPVSTLVTFLLFVRPFVLRLQGGTDLAPKAYAMRADCDWPMPGRFNEFLRARVNPEGGLALYANQGSGVLTSVAWADGLIDNPPGNAITRGDVVRFLPFSALLT